MRVNAVLATVLLAASACGGGEVGTAASGVLPIESDAPLWAADEHWRLAEAPTVSIGVDAGEEPYMFYWVRGALQLPNGSIVVSDGGAHEVRLFDREGGFVRAAGGEGQGPGEFGTPVTMDLFGPTPAAQILVSDAINGRINVFDAEARYTTQITLGDAPNATGGGVAGLFGDGSLLFIAAVGDGALRGDPGTVIRMQLQLLHYSAAGEPLQVLARADSYPMFVNKVGNSTSYPTIPFTSEVLYAAGDERVWLAAGADAEAWAVGFDGTEVARVRWSLPDRQRSSTVYERYVEESLAEIDDENRRIRQQRLLAHELPIPEYVPTHRSLIVDGPGNLWLERYRLPWETQPRGDVVDPRRGRLGEVETPPGFQVTQITADALVGVHHDEAGVSRVQVYALIK